MSETPPRTVDRVLALVLRGYTHPEIAAELHIAVHTASHRVSDLCRLHGVSTSRRLQAKLFAEQARRIAELEAAFAQLERRRGGDRRRSISS